MRQPTAENVIANPVSSLGAPALAFLAGYGVEAVFRMLDGLADQFLRGAEVKWCPPTKRWPGKTAGLETGFLRLGIAAVPPLSCGKREKSEYFMLFHGHSGIARTSEALGLRVNRDNVMPLNIVGVCVHGLGGNFFSTGMDTLAAELNRITPVGCHFTVRGGNDPRLEDATITSDLLSALAKGATVIYIGHSLGADSALRFTQAAHNFKLPLICPVDPVSWDSNAQQVVPGRWEVGSNVERVIGYRTNTFPGGGRIVLAAGNTVTNLTDTTLNVPHASPPGGLDIASSPEVHAAIVAGVHDVVTQMQAVA